MPVYEVVVFTLDKAETIYRDNNNDYLPCDQGTVYVLAKSPKPIYDVMPDVVSVTRVGLGVILEVVEPQEDGLEA